MTSRGPAVHLNVYSTYSLLASALRISSILDLCQRFKMPAVAVTDRSNLFGALEFSLEASSRGIQPIVGCDLFLRLPDDQNRWPRGGFVNKKQHTQSHDLLEPVTLWVQSEEGYKNLLTLVSQSYWADDVAAAPHVGLQQLQQHAEGLLIGLGGGYSQLYRQDIGQIPDKVNQIVCDLQQTFKDRLLFKVSRHGYDYEQQHEPLWLDMADRLSVPLVAAQNIVYAEPQDHLAYEALCCIAQGTYIQQQDRPRTQPEHEFKSSKDIQSLFEDLPEALDNMVWVAQRCHYFPHQRKPILPICPLSEGKTETEALSEMARQGLKKRLDALSAENPNLDIKAYDDRLEFELGVINQTGFQGYFLIVADFIQWAKRNHIPVGPGRGSGAGSVVAWALQISDLDPLRWGLLFERFLNPERVSMPDFDIDFCQDRRDEVIAYVQSRYGADRVAHIITFGKLQARAVLRDVGRVLQMPYSQVDRICKMIPNNPAQPITLAEAIASDPALQQLQTEDVTVDQMISIALRLEGLYRHASTHAAGVVIGDRPLQELIPLYRDPKSSVAVTQFSMKYVEKAGLIKFDFLGLKTLTIIQKTLEILKDQGVFVDLDHIPLDHEPTFRLLAEGQTTGVFQFDSLGMRDVLRKVQPNRFEDIIAIGALYRPGPMDNIPRYIACKHGLEQPDYLHPSLEPILHETFGIMVYQEQVMQIAQVLAGYSLGEADLLRRAMGKKIKEEMEAQRKTFVQRAVDRGVEDATAGYIFDQVNKFAGYGFNKSHAAAYALISYQTAYLKANYPVEFMAATMTFDMDHTDKLEQYVQELGNMNIPLLPPDMMKSQSVFSVENHQIQHGGGHEVLAKKQKAVRYALSALKGVGRGAIEAWEGARQDYLKAHPDGFPNIYELLIHFPAKWMNKRLFESLVFSGALDCIDPRRHILADHVDVLMRWSQDYQNQTSDQTNLLDALMTGPVQGPKLRSSEPWSPIQILDREADAIGFYLSGHPVEHYRSLHRWLKVESPFGSEASQATKKCMVMLKDVQKKISARGHPFAFVSFSHPEGSFEATMFREIFEKAQNMMEVGGLYLVTLSLQSNRDDLRWLVQSIEPIQPWLNKPIHRIKIQIESKDYEWIQLRFPSPGNWQTMESLQSSNGIKSVEVIA